MADVIAEKIKDLIGNLLQDNGIDLVDVTYRREQGGMTLRFLVDKAGGITLNECAGLNGVIGELLDREDVIQEHYVLEVSSPGLDRPLKTGRDFERAAGKAARIHTYEPVAGRRDFEGEVGPVGQTSVYIGGIEIDIENIAKARLRI